MHEALRCGGGSLAALPAGCRRAAATGIRLKPPTLRSSDRSEKAAALRDKTTADFVRQARESDRRTDLVSPLTIEVERQI